jgi:DNA invertase Pin-like site-specific DNA recombinase
MAWVQETTWEPSEHIEHRTDLINQYRDMVLINQLGMKTGGYIYCRVSSKEQSKYNNGHTSLQVQEQEIRKYCENNDINVIKVVHEVFSARNMDKLSGLQYLCGIASNGQTIYVYDISRFSRNVHHALNLLEDLKNNKISVTSVTENITYGSATEKNHFRLHLCASTYYSDICSQKVKASIAFRRARGDHIGRTPYGFKTEVDEKHKCVPWSKTHVR